MSNDSFIKRTGKNILSGTVGGIAVCLVGHPFDTLKVRLQTQSAYKPVYSGLADCFVKTLKWEGIGGLYKGVGSPIVGQMFFRATLFSSYFQFSSMLSDGNGSRISLDRYFIAGGLTGAVASLVECPIDLFKTKMQIEILRAKSGEVPLYRNVFHAGYVILHNHGLKGAYQGLPATVIRNIPAFTLYFGVYEMCRTVLTPEGGTIADLSMNHQLLSGAMGGFSYWFFTYPLDVIKSAMQSDHSAAENRVYRSWVQCMLTLYKDEGGIKRFFKGFTPCMIRSVPANAVMLTVVDQCKRLLN